MGFNVAALDLRSFGMTELTSPAPSTAGWKEGLDILALAALHEGAGLDQRRRPRHLARRQLGAERLRPGGHRDRPRRRDPRGLAARGAQGRLGAALRAGPARPPPLPAPSRLRGGADLEGALGSLAPGGRGHESSHGVRHGAVLRRHAEEIWTHARGIDHVPNAKVPLLILHPEDDYIVKVEQARMLAQAAKGNDLVRVWILPAGSHGLLDAADPRWTHAVYRMFFERWATYAERDRRAGQPGEAAELVYSAQEPG